jgi:branched-subunit amino acid transport protein
MMTWTVIALLTLGSAGQRLLGMFAVGPLLEKRPEFRLLGELLPAAVVTALIVQLSFVNDGSIRVDARAAAIVVAGVLVWRRAPLIVVVAAAAVVAAGLRALGLS